MYKVPVVIKEDYIVFLEPGPNTVMVHCDVKTKWSRGVKASLLNDWKSLQSLHGYMPMCALHEPHRGTKHKKFLKLMGFKHYINLDQGNELWIINKEV